MIKSENDIIEKEFNQLKLENSELLKKNKNLLNQFEKISLISNDFENLTEQNKKLKKENSDLRNKYDEIQRRHEILCQTQNETENKLENISIDQKINITQEINKLKNKYEEEIINLKKIIQKYEIEQENQNNNNNLLQKNLKNNKLLNEEIFNYLTNYFNQKIDNIETFKSILNSKNKLNFSNEDKNNEIFYLKKQLIKSNKKISNLKSIIIENKE